MKPYYICQDCGHAIIGIHPGKCPICSAAAHRLIGDDDHLSTLQTMIIRYPAETMEAAEQLN
jgi:hypothetical protein